MSTLNLIIDKPLPLNQDYNQLKAQALAYIQEHSGNEWTNLNEVDPGVTILDQVCYALTELGYCNDFSVADILTAADGTLQLKDQFYLPEEILTSSPVTVDDYRKCLIDGINGVSNAVIIFMPPSESNGSGAYQVFLQPYSSIVSAGTQDELCKAAFVYLNKWRNLGEMFLQPQCLINDPHIVKGKIEISDEAELKNVLVNLQQQIQQYLFPQVKPIGYDALQARGMRTEEIFNGPLLQNGWIPTSALGEKKDQLQLIELQQLILTIPSIISVTDLAFDQQSPVLEIHTTADKLLIIDWLTSLNKGLYIYCKGKKLIITSNLRALSVATQQSLDPGLLFGTAANIRTTVPAGKFRDINSYYSIQNTFPEIYAVGADAIEANATDFQIAQSRQLKGYLTLFDQVLANQFSQLANIGTLFSFKNALSGTPSDQAQFYAGRDAYEKMNTGYPVPYLTFSPTYFYQSLYAVPAIRPLLKDNEIFNFSLEEESEKVLEEKSWIAYKLDPYNSYIKGLMDIMEEDMTSILRRNAMLDHLLARHGESPLLIDALLNGSSYAGESLKDQVIFKSLYLQNLGLLSYFRQKAYNYLGAKKISDKLLDVPLNFDRQIMSGYRNDFIFNSEQTNKIEELTAQDFVNYSALELKLSLLFGLKVQYRDFIANNYDLEASAVNLKLAMWMILERRGLVMIETDLLLSHATIPYSGGQIVLIFPSFIPQLNTETFKDRLDLFLAESMPVHVSYSYHFVNSSTLEMMTIAFTDWHNSLIYPSDEVVDKGLVSSASSLIKLINQINSDDHE